MYFSVYDFIRHREIGSRKKKFSFASVFLDFLIHKADVYFNTIYRLHFVFHSNTLYSNHFKLFSEI